MKGSSKIGLLRQLLLSAAIVSLGAFAVPAVVAQSDSFPPSSGNLPFEAWLNGKNISQIPWTISIAPPAMTDYQRYQADIIAYVFLDKADASNRDAKLRSVARFTDSRGKTYEATSEHALTARTADQDPEIVVSFTAYLLPGDYKVAMAVYGT